MNPKVSLRQELLEEIDRITKADPVRYPDIETFVNDACVDRIAHARKNLPGRKAEEEPATAPEDGAAEFQVQPRITCLACGGRVDDELCVGPYLIDAVVVFNKDEFRDNPLDLGHTQFEPKALAKMPWVEDGEGIVLPDHPVILALKGKAV